MPKVYIYREIADEVVTKEAMRRLELGANVLASKIEQNLIKVINLADTREAAVKTKSGLVTKTVRRYQSRPIYRTNTTNKDGSPHKISKYAGKWWTARDAGELLRSVRVVKPLTPDPKDRNIWVVVGNSKAYYAAIFEYSTDPNHGHKFYRPALASAKPRIKSVIENG